MARKRRNFTPEFKDEAVRFVRERGLTIAQGARELDIGESTLGRWVQQATAVEAAAGEPLSHQERDELRRLRRENSRLREEREILKKAAAFFANENG